MKKHYKKNINNEEQKVDEPLVAYQTKNRIKIYHSFEEEAEDNYKFLASLSAEEHLANIKSLIDRVYSKKITDQNTTLKRIKFN